MVEYREGGVSLTECIASRWLIVRELDLESARVHAWNRSEGEKLLINKPNSCLFPTRLDMKIANRGVDSRKSVHSGIRSLNSNGRRANELWLL